MKKLLPTDPPTIVIPTSNVGTRRGPDSRGIRICVAQIGRSCQLQQGYVTFTDGSAYVYDGPSNAEFEALCASIQRGKQFNFQVRRATSGYERGFTPPDDYEIIYTYPPYPGTAPDACPLPGIDWSQIVWDAPVIDVGVPARTMTASSTDNYFVFFCDGRPSDPSPSDFPNAQVSGTLTYTGDDTTSSLGFAIDVGPSEAEVSIIEFTQDGNPIDISFPNPSVSGDYPFDIVAGTDSVIRLVFYFQGVTGQGPCNSSGIFTPSSV